MNGVNEKTYNTMTFGGIMSVVVGIIILATGIVTGVLLMVSGAKLIKDKSNIIF